MTMKGNKIGSVAHVLPVIFVTCLLVTLTTKHSAHIEEDGVSYSYIDQECGQFPESLQDRERWSLCWINFIKTLPGSSSLSSIMVGMLSRALEKLLDGYKQVILLDVPVFENKGDPGMALGELSLLHKLGKEVVFICTYGCGPREWEPARQLVDDVGVDKVALLAHGGGNLGAYFERDMKRFSMMHLFHDVKFILLPESSFFNDSEELAFSKVKYSSHADLTILLRNLPSYIRVRTHMPLVNSIATPDIAYGIEKKREFLQPIYDIIVSRREDKEAVSMGKLTFPPGVTYCKRDWAKEWPTPQGETLHEQLNLFVTNAFIFLQRGRVLITDRFHGYVFSSMMDNYPVVLLDNGVGKSRDTYITWGSSQRLVLATSAAEAVGKAMELLHRFYPDRSIVATD